MAKIDKYCAASVYDPPGYSQGVRVTGAQAILFLAGQVAYDKDGSVKHRGDFRGQAREVFAAVKALVEAGGGTLDNVVKVNTYVTDVRYRPEFRAIREEFFGPKGPASTMVEVRALAHPDYLIEVEATHSEGFLMASSHRRCHATRKLLQPSHREHSCRVELRSWSSFAP